jgi:hypothetical protein
MPTLDLTKLSTKSRDRYLRIGRRYGSSDTLKQSNKTLRALDSHADLLVDHGFGADDALRLAAARDALSAAGFGRETKATEKKTTRKEYLAALAQAKTARAKARTILENTLVALDDAGDDESAHKVESTLAQTSVLPGSGQDEKLASQLDLLGSTLTETAIAKAAKNRGGAKAAAALQETAAALRSAAEERENTGTRLSTEEMDVIDGIIVTLCRAARNAARQASAELAQPALLADFALTHIADARDEDAGPAETSPKSEGTTPNATGNTTPV